ncbi:hypothetical protein [Kitasatospora griseola]|uniref:hypothetical protein n=1 Tax=Kitasatospora griseola TaxID=2064 RepID=UPI003427338D
MEFHDELAGLRTMPNRPAAETLYDAADGTLSVGLRLDLQEAAALALHDTQGVIPTAITGAPGSGVSALLDTLWAGEQATDLVTSWLVDTTGAHHGHPAPVRSASTTAEAVELLDNVYGLARARIRAVRTAVGAWSGYRPTPQEPLLTVTVVGLGLYHRLSAFRRLQDALEGVARVARLGGVSLRCVEAPGRQLGGQLGRFFAHGNRVEMLAGLPGADRQAVLPGAARLTPPSGSLSCCGPGRRCRPPDRRPLLDPITEEPHGPDRFPACRHPRRRGLGPVARAHQPPHGTAVHRARLLPRQDDHGALHRPDALDPDRLHQQRGRLTATERDTVHTTETTTADTARDEDPTQVTLELVTDDGETYRRHRDLTPQQLVALLLAFDDCEDEPEDPDELREVTLEYGPAEYGGRRWRVTRHFTDDNAARVLTAFEAGQEI